MSDPNVLIIGMACLDMKGRALSEFTRATSMPGNIRASVGGVARNIAEDLSHLGVRTRLLSAVGDDRSGRRIMNQAAEVGIDASSVLVVPNTSSGAYMALLNQDGALEYAIDDTRIARAISSRYLYNRRRMIRNATMVVLDANLPPASIKTVFRTTRKYDIPVCADPTSASLAPRLIPYLPELTLITPNNQEAEVLCGFPIPDGNRKESLEAAKCLVGKGVQIAVVTMAEHGLAYATNEESGFVPALTTEVIDLTGGGDALTAAIIFGLLNEIPSSEAMRLGCSAASLTIACDQTVVPDLSQELLYDHLSV